jgi:phosphoserine phosphatase
MDFDRLHSTLQMPTFSSLGLSLNINISSFALTESEKQKYAVLKALCGSFSTQRVGALSARTLDFDGQNQWSISEPVERVNSEWTLHIVFHSPTFELMELLLKSLPIQSKSFKLHTHMCSDLQSGLMGFVLELDNETAKKLADVKVLEKTRSAFSVDIALIKNSPRLHEPGLLVMDMDSTVIAIECIDEIAKLAGVGQQVAEVTERAMQGELDFSESLRSRVACLAGLDETALLHVQKSLPLMPGLTRLIANLKQNGWRIAIASGGFTYYAEYLQKRLGLDAAVANKLEITDNKLTGKVEGDIVDAQTKADTVQQLVERWTIVKSQTIAMGDGANDLKMMSASHLGVAYKAKPIVCAAADSSIVFGGLDQSLFYLR